MAFLLKFVLLFWRCVSALVPQETIRILVRQNGYLLSSGQGNLCAIKHALPTTILAWGSGGVAGVVGAAGWRGDLLPSGRGGDLRSSCFHSNHRKK